ncbi:cytochrome P450 10-like [Branchiostoma floridae x Branchiostoma japonicum]
MGITGVLGRRCDAVMRSGRVFNGQWKCGRFSLRNVGLCILRKSSSTVTNVGMETCVDPTANKTDVAVRPFHDIPGPKGLPIIGSLWEYTFLGKLDPRRFDEVLWNRYQEYGKIYKEDLGPRGTFVRIADPGDIETVYRNEGRYPHRPSFPLVRESMEAAGQELLKHRARSESSFNGQGLEWYRTRSAVNRTLLRRSGVALFHPTLNEISDDFLALLKRSLDENNTVPDITWQIRRYNTEVAGTTIFGRRPGCLEPDFSGSCQTSEMIKSIDDFFASWLKLEIGFPLTKYLLKDTWNGYMNAHRNILRIVKYHMDLDVEYEDDRPSVLGYLLSESNLSDTDAAMSAVELFVGGMQSSSHADMFQLYELARHPHVQETIRREVTEALPKGEAVTSAHLHKLPYLKAFVKETFRFHPVGLLHMRILDRDVVLSGYRVPAHTTIEIPMSVLGRLEELYPQADRFLPERWLRRGPNGFRSRMFSHVTPFGHGPRACIGRRLAEDKFYIQIAKLVQNFDLHCDEEVGTVTGCFQELSPTPNIRLTPR